MHTAPGPLVPQCDPPWSLAANKLGSTAERTRCPCRRDSASGDSQPWLPAIVRIRRPGLSGCCQSVGNVLPYVAARRRKRQAPSPERALHPPQARPGTRNAGPAASTEGPRPSALPPVSTRGAPVGGIPPAAETFLARRGARGRCWASPRGSTASCNRYWTWRAMLGAACHCYAGSAPSNAFHTTITSESLAVERAPSPMT